MSPMLSMLRDRVRLIAGATAVALVMATGVPAALASYTSTFTPSAQTVQPQPLATPVLSCSAPGLGGVVTLSWTDSDSTTTDPHNGAKVISGYVIERKVDNNGTYAAIVTTPDVTSSVVLTATDSPPGLSGLGLLTPIFYRIHSNRGNWISQLSNQVTATVTALVLVHVISC